jgi:two-component system chemotaxis response regulator CheY
VGKKIIVIDDSETVREHVRQVLAGEGYDILEASDGVQGAAAIRQNPTASLAICDVNMPNLGGLDMLQSLLDSETGEPGPVPILMLASEGRADMMERARACGARGWIVKPFHAKLLLATVRKLAGAVG